MEKEIKFLEKLGYTVKHLRMQEYVPANKQRGEKEDVINHQGYIAYKGKEPKLYAAVKDHVSQYEFMKSKYNLMNVFTEEWNKALFNTVFNSL